MEEHPCSLLCSVLHSHVIWHRSCCIEINITLAHWVHQLALYCCYIAALKLSQHYCGLCSWHCAACRKDNLKLLSVVWSWIYKHSHCHQLIWTPNTWELIQFIIRYELSCHRCYSCIYDTVNDHLKLCNFTWLWMWIQSLRNLPVCQISQLKSAAVPEAPLLVLQSWLISKKLRITAILLVLTMACIHMNMPRFCIPFTKLQYPCSWQYHKLYAHEQLRGICKLNCSIPLIVCLGRVDSKEKVPSH